MGAIGGYLELDLPKGAQPYAAALRYQSGRAAFSALLAAGKPKRVLMPRHICDAMLSPLAAAGIEPSFYSIDRNFGVSEEVELSSGDWLLYVNYFGINDRNVESVLSRFNPGQVVIDNSQAFFSAPRPCLATIYSPRKFFGVPDGGVLCTQLPIQVPAKQESGSMDRMRHLLLRLVETPEAGYADYQRAEQSLHDVEPRRMSSLTQRLLEGQHYETVRAKRNANFSLLRSELKELNSLSGIEIAAIDGPLCYPFLTERSGLRQKLIERRIFVPTYWPEVLSRVKHGSDEALLVTCCLPIPCDQRYGAAEMGEVCRIIKKIAIG